MQSFVAVQKQKVLIVDDEPLISESLTLVFRQEGFEVRTAYSAELALDQIRKWRPALAIIDICLGRMDGIRFALHLKRACPNCKVLLFSGSMDSDAVVRQAEAIGLEFIYVEKPIHPAALVAAARKLMNPRINAS